MPLMVRAVLPSGKNLVADAHFQDGIAASKLIREFEAENSLWPAYMVSGAPGLGLSIH